MRSTVLGDVLRAIAVEYVAAAPVPIRGFATGELREFAFAETLRRHGGCLFSLKLPPRRGKRGYRNNRTEGEAAQITVE
jgi:hypothetical protein